MPSQTWTEPYRLAIPADLIPLGNEAAALFDPNGGGAFTFTTPNAGFGGTEATHCLVQTQLIDGYQHSLAQRDPEQWFALLGQMAVERGLPALSMEEVETLCDEFLFDDECGGLEMIEPTAPIEP